MLIDSSWAGTESFIALPFQWPNCSFSDKDKRLPSIKIQSGCRHSVSFRSNQLQSTSLFFSFSSRAIREQHRDERRDHLLPRWNERWWKCVSNMGSRGSSTEMRWYCRLRRVLLKRVEIMQILPIWPLFPEYMVCEGVYGAFIHHSFPRRFGQDKQSFITFECRLIRLQSGLHICRIDFSLCFFFFFFLMQIGRASCRERG